jgi:DNA-directed RNA polymerase subunit beta'
LTALEYFISTHGARKGLADTALRTADAGYLTRRLVDIAQDVIINDVDCETLDGSVIRSSDDIAGQSIGSRIYGRYAAAPVIDPNTGEVLVDRDEMINNDQVRRILNAEIDEVTVRSPLTCELSHGICSKCYGMDLGRGNLVEVGSAVHTGGVAAVGDITTGLPRVEELFEARKTPKGEAVVTEIAGVAHVEQSDRYSDLRVVRVEHSEMIGEEYDLPPGWTITVEDGGEVKQGGTLASLEDATIVAQNAGRVRIEQTDDKESEKVVVSYEVRQEEEYDIPSNSRLLVKSGDHVEPGQPLTEGSLNPHLILRIQGRHECQKYLMSEVQKVYRSQGQNINDKHFEVITRKMMSKVQITRPGDTTLLPGDLVDYLELKRENERLLSEDKRPARYMEILLGITKASLSTESFLSASSFQHTIKVLAQAAIAATEDNLYGLKENVIIGKLIPAGTGFVPGRFDEEEIEDVLLEEDELEEKILAEVVSEDSLETPPPVAAD